MSCLESVMSAVPDSDCALCICLECERYIPFYGCTDKACLSVFDSCTPVKECVRFVMPSDLK